METSHTLAVSEERYVLTAATSSESPLAGSTITEPCVLRNHTQCLAPSLERYVHVAPVERPGPPSSRLNSLRRLRRATGKVVTFSCTIWRTPSDAYPITTTAQDNDAPRRHCLRQVTHIAPPPPILT